MKQPSKLKYKGHSTTVDLDFDTDTAYVKVPIKFHEAMDITRKYRALIDMASYLEGVK